MSEPGRNERLAQELVDAYNRGDHGRLIERFDPAIECHVSADLMNAGTWRGIDGFDEMMAAWNEAWGELQMRILDLEAPDDRHVIAQVHQRGIGAGSGVPVELDVYLLVEAADDLAKRLHVYADRESAIAAVR